MDKRISSYRELALFGVLAATLVLFMLVLPVPRQLIRYTNLSQTFRDLQTISIRISKSMGDFVRPNQSFLDFG